MQKYTKYIAVKNENGELIPPKKIYFANESNSIFLIYVRQSKLVEGVDYEVYERLYSDKFKYDVNDLMSPRIDLMKFRVGLSLEIFFIKPDKTKSWLDGVNVISTYLSTQNNYYLSVAANQSNGIWLRYTSGPSITFKNNNTTYPYHTCSLKITTNSSYELTANYNNGEYTRTIGATSSLPNIIDKVLFIAPNHSCYLTKVIISDENDNVLMDLVPCKLLTSVPQFLTNNSDGKINSCGMIDRISKKFYGKTTSSGSYAVCNDSTLYCKNPSFYNNFQNYVTKISSIQFTNVIPNTSNIVDNNLVDVSISGYYIKVYMWLVDNGNDTYTGYIGSDRYDAVNNSVFYVEGEVENLFRLLNYTDFNILDHFNFESVTSYAYAFYNCKVTIVGKESMFSHTFAIYPTAFYYYKGLGGIDVSKFRMSGVTYCFCASASNFINWENFNCDKLTFMEGMFYTNEMLDLSMIGNWDTSKVKSISKAFANLGRSSTKYLSMENWDLRACTTTEKCFDYNEVANTTDWIKTPAYSAQVDINLINTYYNADGTIYGNVIPANSVGSVRIYRTQALAAQFNSAITFINRNNDGQTVTEYLENNTEYTIPSKEGYSVTVTDSESNSYTDGDSLTITQNLTLTFTYTEL